ncbi:hypothetical protein H4582DRAFT_2059055 [Lactarius indigo]|nr:hypothetical protein H4582DRAFT_2059055 [Lactarius indigo]
MQRAEHYAEQILEIRGFSQRRGTYNDGDPIHDWRTISAVYKAYNNPDVESSSREGGEERALNFVRQLNTELRKNASLRQAIGIVVKKAKFCQHWKYSNSIGQQKHVIYVGSPTVMIYIPVHMVASSATGGTGYLFLYYPSENYVSEETETGGEPFETAVWPTSVLRGHEIGTRACLELVNVETTPPGSKSERYQNDAGNGKYSAGQHNCQKVDTNRRIGSQVKYAAIDSINRENVQHVVSSSERGVNRARDLLQ